MKKHIVLILILFFLIQYYSVSSNETDQEALLAFQNLVTSPTPFLAKNWTSNTSFCSWFGVSCSPKRQRVVALTLPGLQLEGTISPSLANLSFLRELNLGNNNFHGGIPYGIGHLPRLRLIDIQNNQLQGSIPISLFQHQRVQKISLAFNELGGELWKGPWYASKLRVLDLSNNNLTEYGSEGIVSTSGDVYSYGIMLMEVLAKRRPTDEEIFNENLGLREWIRRAFPRTVMEVVDADLFLEEEQITSKSEISIASMIELALDCTKEMSDSRITMKDVVKRLNKIKNTFLKM